MEIKIKILFVYFKNYEKKKLVLESELDILLRKNLTNFYNVYLLSF